MIKSRKHKNSQTINRERYLASTSPTNSEIRNRRREELAMVQQCLLYRAMSLGFFHIKLPKYPFRWSHDRTAGIFNDRWTVEITFLDINRLSPSSRIWTVEIETGTTDTSFEGQQWRLQVRNYQKALQIVAWSNGWDLQQRMNGWD